MPVRFHRIRSRVAAALASIPLSVAALVGAGAAVAAPDCSSAYASPATLWPPNHKFRPVTIEGVRGEGKVTVDVACVHQDEPTNATGDGNTALDAWGVGTDRVRVRRERRGHGNGRVYTIAFSARDASGGSCWGTARVGVPKKRKVPAFDDGARYASTPLNAERCDAPPNTAPVAHEAMLFAEVDVPLALVLEAEDAEDDALRFTVNEPPASGTLSGTAPELVYTPDPGFVGRDRFSFEASDDAARSAPATVTIEVVQPNRPPTVEASGGRTLDVGRTAELRGRGSDPDGDPLTYLWSLVAAPDGSVARLEGAGRADARLAPDLPGDYALELVVSDGELRSAPAPLTLTALVNRAPRIVSAPPASVTERSPYAYDVEAVDPDDDPLRYALLSSPAGMAIDAATGLIDWRPTAEYAQPVLGANAQCQILVDAFDGTVHEGDPASATGLYRRVRDAIRRGSDYAAPETERWHRRHGCLGCHVQNQTLVGLQAAREKADVDEEVAEYLLAEILASQRPDGSILRSHTHFGKTQTAFALWALSFVPDRTRTLAARARALDYFAERASRSGDTTYWRRDHESGWLRRDPGMTAVVALGAGRYLADVREADAPTEAQLATAVRFELELPRIARHLLAERDRSTADTLSTALVLVGLAELRPELAAGELRSAVDETVAALDAALRGRQAEDGGWSAFPGGASDPLVTAWVGIALDHQSPPPSDPAVGAAIEYLLGEQAEDGTWETGTGLFDTRLGTTGLVMAYLPVALEYLASPDLTLHDIAYDAAAGTLGARVINRGSGDLDAPITLRFAEGEPGEGRPLGQGTLEPLAAGETRRVSVPAERPTGDVFAALDADPTLAECVLENNRAVAAFAEIEASDGRGGSDRQIVLVNVGDENDPPRIETERLPPLRAGLPYEGVLEAADPDLGDVLRFSIAEGPDGLSIDSRTGALAYDADALAAGEHEIVLVVTDARGLSVERRYTLTVSNSAPVAIAQTLAVTAGDPLSITLAGTDADGDALGYAVVAPPARGTLEGTPPELTYTPEPGYAGTDSFRFEASDGGLVSTPATVSITVVPRLVVADATMTLDEDDSGSVALVVEGAGPGVPALSMATDAEHGHATLDGTVLRYVPDPDYFGADSVTVVASVGARLSAPLTVPIAVRPVNDAPTIDGDAPAPHVIERSLSSAVPLDLSNWEAVDYDSYDGDGPAEWVVDEEARRIVQRRNSNPSVYLGPDGSAGSVLRGTITVDTSDDDDYVGFVFGFEDRNSFYLLDWKQNDQSWALGFAEAGLSLKRFDLPGDALPEFWPASPSNGEVLHRGSIGWRDRTTYDVSIALLDGLIHVSVQDDGELVEAFAVDGERVPAGRFGFYNYSQSDVIYAGLLRGSLSGGSWHHALAASDVDSDSLVWTLLEGPDGMTLDRTAGTLAWSLGTGRVGEHRVVVAVEDGDGGREEATYAVRIDDELPLVLSEPVTRVAAGADYAYRVLAVDPSPGDTLAHAVAEGPDGLAIDRNDGRVSWTTDALDVGRHAVKLVVTDGAGHEAVQAFEIAVYAPGTPVDAPPRITSVPPSDATVGAEYAYAVRAEDADGDPIDYALIEGPAGMALEADGTLRWTPGRVGEERVRIEASDGASATEQSWSIAVSAAGEPLAATLALSAGRVVPGEPLTLSVEPAGGEGPIAVAARLAGEAIVLDEGFEGSFAAPEVPGTYDVVVSVSDARASLALVARLDVVRNDAPNAPPVFDGVPTGVARVGVPFEDGVGASDPDGDALAHELLEGPEGMTLDADGTLRWLPDTVGEVAVRISVSDGRATLERAWTIVVRPAVTPAIASEPSRHVRTGTEYRYALALEHAEGLPLSFSVTEGPTGASIDAAGILRWTPAASGTAALAVAVDYGAGTLTQRWTVDVRAADDTLSATLAISPATIGPGETVTVALGIGRSAGAVALEARLDGEPLATGESGTFSFAAPEAPGDHALEITLVDALDTLTLSETITVATDGGGTDGGDGDGGGDESDGVPPTLSLVAPLADAIVTAPVEVRGSVEDADLVAWRLELADGSTETLPIASGDTPVVDDVLGTLDPTLLTNGARRLRLVATDRGGLTRVEELPVTIDGDLKVGNFSVTFEDLSIPMVGIPIEITRTYDSRRRHEALDFGHGWSIDYQNVSISESRAPGRDWNLNRYSTGPLGVLTNFCVEPAGEPTVTVTLPDGRVEAFAVAASPRCNLTPILDVTLDFEPEPGTTSTLEAAGGAFGRLNVASGVIGDIAGTDPLDPDRYHLTTEAGYVYTLDQGFGIETVTDPNGHTLTYSDGGIVHSAGKRIDFVRDAAGRITEISDPEGNLISYEYDAAGDLASVMDRGFATTDFTYDAGHGLVDIVDPLGRRVVRNLYDDDGRLVAQEDGDGRRTAFDHDLAGRQSTVTDRLGRTTVFYYDERGNVTARVDAAGNTTTFAFDEHDNPISETNALGETTSATFDERRNQITQTDALGNTVSYAHDARGRETRIVDARGNVFENRYDAVGNLLSVTDPLGNVAGQDIDARGLPSARQDAAGHRTAFVHDDEGNLVEETDAEGGVVTYTYDANNNRLSETRSRTLADGTRVDETTRHAYDARDRLVRTVDPLGNVTRTEYDLVGREIGRIDALGRRTSMAYDAYGRLTATTHPDGTTETSAYDAEGNRLADTDRLGRTTTYRHDALDRLVRTTHPDGTSVETRYDAAGRAIAEIDERGNVTAHAYDAAGRRTSTTDALGHTVSFAHDADGNLVAGTDARGHTTRHAYDALDRRTATTFANGTGIRSEHDARGLEIASIDQNGRRTGYAHDGLGRLTGVTDALGQVTAYGYDEAGNKVSQTDALGRTTRWAHDALGRETNRTLPLGQVEWFAYDAAGNRVGHTDFNGATHRFVHDPDSDRLVEERWADGVTVEYGYDAAGRRTSATEAGRTWRYEHDARDRLVREVKPDGRELRYGYDASGHRTALTTLVDGLERTTDHAFDAFGRLASVTDPTGRRTAYTYDASGNEIAVEHANGTASETARDALGRITRMTHLGRAGETLARFDYTLDPTGRRTAIVEASGRQSTYTHDALYRLVGETIVDPANGDHASTWEYDAVGNRVYERVDGVETRYTVDENDRLVRHGGTTLAYDANGNTISETEGGLVTRRAYDSRNRLIESDAGGVTTTFGYDPDGARTSRTALGERSAYLVDANRDYAQVLHERSGPVGMATGTDLQYTYGRDLLGLDTGAERYTYHTDALGSTRLLSDTGGRVADEIGYDAWGETLFGGQVAENRHLYTGERFDNGLGLYHLRARDYAPGTGRFTQMDAHPGSAGDPLTLNKYGYGNADPANVMDPSGHFGLVSFGVANTIRSEISSMQIDVGTSLLDGALDPGGDTAGPSATGLGVAALGGAASFKLLRMLSSKFRAACGGNSFTGDTLVSTADGLLPLEEIEIGDLVWAYDDVDEEHALREVLHLVRSAGESDLYEIGFEDGGERLVATAGHLFRTEASGEWTRADELLSGDRLVALGDKRTVGDVTVRADTERLYNLTVEEHATYYVGTDGVLTHNTDRCKPLTLTAQSRRHLAGEVSHAGRATGWHIRSAGHAGRRIVGQASAPDRNGVYEARVAIKNYRTGEWVEKGPRSTFFPDRYSERQVYNLINKAYTNAIVEKSFDGRKFTGRANGIPIEGIVDSNGSLITAYPVYGN